MNYAQIDWHDFVVVETVLFTEADEQADLPPPPSLNDLQSASLEQKAMTSLYPNNRRIEEAMPTADDWPSYPQQPQQYAQYAPPPQQQQQDEMHVSDNEDDEESRIRLRMEERARAQQAQAEAKGGVTMKIRSDYIPKAAQQAASRRGVSMALCPNCNQQIPYNELGEHMRSRSPGCFTMT